MNIRQPNNERIKRQYSLFLNQLGKCKSKSVNYKGLDEKEKIGILQGLRNGQKAIIEIVQQFSMYKNYKIMESKFKNILRKRATKIDKHLAPFQKQNEKQDDGQLMRRVFSLNILNNPQHSASIHKKSIKIDVDLIRRSQQLKKTFSPRYNSAKPIKDVGSPSNQLKSQNNPKSIYSLQNNRRYSAGTGIKIVSPFCEINENYYVSTQNIAKNRLKSKNVEPVATRKINQKQDSIFSFEIYSKNPQSLISQKLQYSIPFQGRFYQRIRDIIDHK